MFYISIIAAQSARDWQSIKVARFVNGREANEGLS